MKNFILTTLLLIASAALNVGCGKKSPAVAATSSAFPSDLQFTQPEGVK